MTEYHATVADWPPPNDLSAVIAEVDRQWIEVRHKTDWRGQSYGSWENWEPHTLPSHGCGCCSETNPEPTRWFPLPPPATDKENDR